MDGDKVMEDENKNLILHVYNKVTDDLDIGNALIPESLFDNLKMQPDNSEKSADKLVQVQCDYLNGTESFTEKIVDVIDSPGDNSNIEYCGINIDSSKAHCYGLWIFNQTSKQYHILKKGCWLNDANCGKYPKCYPISTSNRSKGLKSSPIHVFCCCHGDRCNRNETLLLNTYIDDQAIQNNKSPFDDTTLGFPGGVNSLNKPSLTTPLPPYKVYYDSNNHIPTKMSIPFNHSSRITNFKKPFHKPQPNKNDLIDFFETALSSPTSKSLLIIAVSVGVLCLFALILCCILLFYKFKKKRSRYYDRSHYHGSNGIICKGHNLPKQPNGDVKQFQTYGWSGNNYNDLPFKFKHWFDDNLDNSLKLNTNHHLPGKQSKLYITLSPTTFIDKCIDSYQVKNPLTLKLATDRDYDFQDIPDSYPLYFNPTSQFYFSPMLGEVFAKTLFSKFLQIIMPAESSALSLLQYQLHHVSPSVKKKWYFNLRKTFEKYSSKFHTNVDNRSQGRNFKNICYMNNPNSSDIDKNLIDYYSNILLPLNSSLPTKELSGLTAVSPGNACKARIVSQTSVSTVYKCLLNDIYPTYATNTQENNKVALKIYTSPNANSWTNEMKIYNLLLYGNSTLHWRKYCPISDDGDPFYQDAIVALYNNQHPNLLPLIYATCTSFKYPTSADLTKERESQKVKKSTTLLPYDKTMRDEDELKDCNIGLLINPDVNHNIIFSNRIIPSLLTPYQNQGSLYEYFHDGNTIDWKTLINLATDISRGLSYLHNTDNLYDYLLEHIDTHHPPPSPQSPLNHLTSNTSFINPFLSPTSTLSTDFQPSNNKPQIIKHLGSDAETNNSLDTTHKPQSNPLFQYSSLGMFELLRRTSHKKSSVVHKDLKSKNVLLQACPTRNNCLKAVICDFGSALILNANQKLQGFNAPPCGRQSLKNDQTAVYQKGTLRYMAPEILEGAISYTVDSFLKIDVYAFALILWELLSRCKDINDALLLKESESYKLPYESELGPNPTIEEFQLSVCAKGLRPKILHSWNTHSTQSASLINTLSDCWEKDPEARISSLTLFERMKDLSNTLE